MSNFKVYMSNDLTNEQYHADTEYVEGFTFKFESEVIGNIHQHAHLLEQNKC